MGLGLSLGLGLVLVACGEGAGTDGGDDDAAVTPPSAVASAASAASGDPLLARARASIVAGELDPQVRDELMDSDAPEHARARRVLAALAGSTGSASKSPPREAAKESPAATGAQGDTPVPVIAPTPDAPSIPKDDEAPGAGGSGGANGGAADGGSNGGSEAGVGSGTTNSADDGSGAGASTTSVESPRLAMLTRLSMTGSPRQVVLTLNAADRVVMGTAEQPDSGLMRLVIESAGALPGFLQARPEMHGVKVVDVRRGDDTVQISISLDAGWKARGPRSGAKGASITFVKEG